MIVLSIYEINFFLSQLWVWIFASSAQVLLGSAQVLLGSAQVLIKFCLKFCSSSTPRSTKLFAKVYFHQGKHFYVPHGITANTIHNCNCNTAERTKERCGLDILRGWMMRLLNWPFLWANHIIITKDLNILSLCELT